MSRALSLAAFAAVAIAAAAALLATPTRADDISPEPGFSPTRSRVAVKAELREYQRRGTPPWADAYDHLRDFRSQMSRRQVREAYQAARADVAARTAEDSGSSRSALPRAPSTVTMVDLDNRH